MLKFVHRLNIPTNTITFPSLLLITLALATLSGCESDNDDSADDAGFVQLYNLSPNAPGIILTLEQDDEDEDENFSTFATDYPTSTGFLASDTGTFNMVLSWQDGDDNDELSELFETSLTISKDDLALIVVAGDIQTPQVHTFEIAIEDDDNDENDELFNLRFLNMQTTYSDVEIYYSRANETFNEAQLLQSLAYSQLTDNQKMDDDDYIFYLVVNGDDQPVYQSDAISFLVGYQYLLVARDNSGAGQSPFTLDKLSRTNSALAYPDSDAEARLQVYNGIVAHELLPSYTGQVDVSINGIESVTQFDALALGEFGPSTTLPFGDYSISLEVPDGDTDLIDNHLLTLPANSDKTIFFYLHEEPLDEDGDGDFDEDGDGYIDAFEITANSLVANNSQSQSIFTHSVQIINLIDDFDYLQVYFVRQGETIASGSLVTTASYVEPVSTTLANNTYKVYLIGQQDSSEMILASQEVTFDESTQAQFLILEERAATPSGYQMSWRAQKVVD